MSAIKSPVLGYNTNVRHAGKLYHIQTEDSGVKRPHIITHLFADGGRIVASRKITYEEHVGADNLHDIVKQMMRDQHKGMFISLRDGEFDESEAAVDAQMKERARTGPAENVLSDKPPPDVGVHPGMALDEVILAYLAEDMEAA